MDISLFVSSFSLFLWIVWQAKEIVTLLILSYCIAYLLNPLINKIESGFIFKLRMPRTLATLLIFAFLTCSLVFILSSAVPTLVEDYEKVTAKLPEYTIRIEEMVSSASAKFNKFLLKSGHGSGTDPLKAALSSIDANSIKGMALATGKALMKGYSFTLTIVNLFLLPFFTFYLCVDFKKIHDGFLALFPVNKRKETAKIFSEIDHYISSFVRGQLMVGLILSILYCIGLGVLGIELWFLLALISGFGNIIPYMGFLIGITLSSLMALFTFGDFTHVVYVWILYLTVQVLEGLVITPKIVGDKVGLGPLSIIIAVFMGGQLFGFLGLLLAVPGAAALKVLMKYFRKWALAETVNA